MYGSHAAIACIVGAMTMASHGAAGAAEITMLVSQGAASAVRDLVPAFEKSSSHKVIVILAQGASMTEKIDSNAPADVVSQLLDQFDSLLRRGKVVTGTAVEYARAGNGVLVKAGAPKPDISTPESFKRAMLNAKSIGHSRNGTGPYNTKLFQRLGIYDQVKDKIILSQDRPVAAYVADGQVEIGLQQTNAIQPFPGTDYVGPLPPDLIEYARFGLGVLTVSKEPEAARAFIAFATSPEAAPLIRKSAMETPAR